jgi:small GTP-binding protein
MMDRERKAILLTPMGSGAIAVIRLVGGGVGTFLAAHFSRKARTGCCVHGELRDGDRVVDEAVVVLGDEGKWADINIHGGPWVVRLVLDLARRQGFAPIECGTLPLPAQALDASTSLEREVLSHLPLARTTEAIRALLGQDKAWRALADTALPPDSKRQRLEAILADPSLHWMLHPPRVAIVGAPNVGKSTLANQLFAQERSITADLPGTTRDWVGEIANIDGLAVMLVDTPGLGQASDEVELQAVKHSRPEVAAADLVVLVLDASLPLAEHSRLLERFARAIVVLNKCDREEAAHSPLLHKQECPALLRTAATTGLGVAELRAAIRRHFGCADLHVPRPGIWTDRQRRIISRAMGDPSAIAELWI